MLWEVRDLTDGDMYDFAELAEGMHAESCYSKYTLDIERTIYIILAMADEDTAYVRGLYRRGKLVGALIGEVTQHPWVDMRLAVEHAFYISPECRGSKGAGILIDDFIAWARRKAADRVQVTAAAKEDNANVSRFLEGMGLRQYGYAHMMEL